MEEMLVSLVSSTISNRISWSMEQEARRLG